MRQIRYRSIAETLRDRIESGEFARGQVLPSEADLGAEFDASRVTVRRALEVLRDDKLIDARQGFGWFVAAEPIPQRLSVLDTIDARLAKEGRGSARQVIDFKFVDSPSHVAGVLGKRSLEVKRISTADGRPFARITVWCREDLGAEVSKAAVERASFHDVLAVEFGRATQTIGASLAGSDDALILGVAPESPVLVVKRTTYLADGSAGLVAEYVFPGHLTEFVVELAADTSSSSTALRLVDNAG